MIQITPQHRLMIKVDPIDFRKGLESIVGFCRQYNDNPFDGTIFAFRNRKGTAVKLLVYDGSGFWLCHKRFSKGKLCYWPTSSTEHVCATNMAVILNQGIPAQMKPAWRALPGSA
jgi:transposase